MGVEEVLALYRKGRTVKGLTGKSEGKIGQITGTALGSRTIRGKTTQTVFVGVRWDGKYSEGNYPYTSLEVLSETEARKRRKQKGE